MTAFFHVHISVGTQLKFEGYLGEEALRSGFGCIITLSGKSFFLCTHVHAYTCTFLYVYSFSTNLDSAKLVRLSVRVWYCMQSEDSVLIKTACVYRCPLGVLQG